MKPNSFHLYSSNLFLDNVTIHHFKWEQANPSRVYALVLRGVCLMRSLEIDYIFGDGAEAGLLNPVPWQRFVEYTGMDPATLKPGGRELLSAYCDRLLGDDVEVRSTAARAWSSWENSIFGWRPAQETPAYLAIKELLPATPRRVLTWDGQQWFLPGTDSTPEAASAIAAQIDLLKQLPEPSSPQPETSSSTTIVGQAASAVATAAVNASVVARDKLGKLANSMNRSKWMPVQNMLTAHYSRSNGFMDDAALLDGVACLRAAGVHGRAIQGGYDSICPPRTAMELHEAWPELEMRVVLEAGHSMYDPGITSEIVKATDNFRERRE
jgi:proline iminopeptidase